MFDLDTLRPEVREAAAKLDDFDSAFGTGGCWQIIRAELLRLADEAAHDAEDALHASFIQHVADTAGGDLAEMAREVLKTADIDFARWGA